MPHESANSAAEPKALSATEPKATFPEQKQLSGAGAVSWVSASQAERELFKHGEISFPVKGVIVKYLLIPASKAHDSESILRTILSPELGWGLELPKLTVQIQGPQGYWQRGFHNSKAEAEWGSDPKAREERYLHCIKSFGCGLSKAVGESNGWLFSTCCDYYSHDHAGAVMEPAIDAQRRDPTAKMPPYIGCKVMSNLKNYKHETLDRSKPFELHFPQKIDLAEKAVHVGQCVTERIEYPWLRHLAFPNAADHQDDTDKDKFVNPDPGVANSLIPHFVSHMLIFDNVTPLLSSGLQLQSYQCWGSCRPDMDFEALVTTTFAHAAVIIGGKHVRNVIRYSSELTRKGATVVALDSTGQPAEYLCQEVRNLRRSMKGPRSWTGEKSGWECRNEWDWSEEMQKEAWPRLGTDVNHKRYLIFDALTDTADKVASRLTKALSHMGEDDIRELGFSESERQRLREAWVLHMKLKINAERQSRAGVALQFSVVILAFATTLCAILGEEAREHQPESPNMAGLNLLVGLLPMTSSLLQSIMGAFSPISKAAYLSLGAENVRSEIYKYRCRIAQYLPPRQNKMADLFGTEANKISTKATKPQGAMAQANFAAVLERLEKDALADMRTSFTVEPSDIDMKNMARTFQEPPGEWNGYCAALLPSFLTSSTLRKITPQPKNPDEMSKRKQDNFLEDTAGGDFFSLMSAVVQEDGEDYDDFASLLSGEDYVNFRLQPLLAHFRMRGALLERLSYILQTLMFLSTFIAAVLSFVGLSRWIPIAVASYSSLSSMLDFWKIQTRLSNCNQARQDLENLHRWWCSLSMVRRRDNDYKQTLVELTERSCDAEASVWAKASSGRSKDGGKDDGDKEDLEAAASTR